MFLLQSTGGGIPFWVVIIVAVIPTIGSIVLAVLGYFFVYRKNREETSGVTLKNEEQKLKNTETRGDLLDEAEAKIDSLRKERFTLKGEIDNLKLNEQSFGIKIAEKDGEIRVLKEQKKDDLKAVTERDERILRLKDEKMRLIEAVEHEKKICQEQIAALSQQNTAQFDEVKGQLEEIKQYVQEKGLTLPGAT